MVLGGAHGRTWMASTLGCRSWQKQNWRWTAFVPAFNFLRADQLRGTPKGRRLRRRFRLDSRSSCLQEVTPALNLTLGVQGVPTVGRSSSTKTAHWENLSLEWCSWRRSSLSWGIVEYDSPVEIFGGDEWNIVECFFVKPLKLIQNVSIRYGSLLSSPYTLLLWVGNMWID